MDKREIYNRWHDTMCALGTAKSSLEAALRHGDPVLLESYKAEIQAVLKDLNAINTKVQKTTYQVRDAQ